MNNIGDKLEKFTRIARENESVRRELLASRESQSPYSEFCRIAQKEGIDLSVMDLIDIGNEYISLLERSVNGGGATHTVLNGEDDFYEQFFIAIGE